MKTTEYKIIHDGYGAPPVVSLDTARTILMPAYLWEEGVGEDYLRLNGMGPGAGETTVVSAPHGDMVAVMCVAVEVPERLRAKFGPGVRFTSPLLEIARGGKRDVNIYLTGKNVYLAVWEKGLKMAEALPDNSLDSLLYYMQVVGRRFKLRKFDINIGGELSGLAAKTLREYFDRVKTVSL